MANLTVLDHADKVVICAPFGREASLETATKSTTGLFTPMNAVPSRCFFDEKVSLNRYLTTNFGHRSSRFCPLPTKAKPLPKAQAAHVTSDDVDSPVVEAIARIPPAASTHNNASDWTMLRIEQGFDLTTVS
ncbi:MULTISPECIES: hypothetical protein [unclassified Burkholderia]|uniref:hypothetical protein n=1 Tax=unclassified Burkholderia TaxID=2613784 RepID=UPI000F58D0C4|nr:MULTISPECIES: hypothetical protein [unclassified Burkholderia]